MSSNSRRHIIGQTGVQRRCIAVRMQMELHHGLLGYTMSARAPGLGGEAAWQMHAQIACGEKQAGADGERESVAEVVHDMHRPDSDREPRTPLLVEESVIAPVERGQPDDQE